MGREFRDDLAPLVLLRKTSELFVYERSNQACDTLVSRFNARNSSAHSLRIKSSPPEVSR